MKIDVRSENSLYIEIGGWTFYIDDSTNEQIMSKWETITGDSDTDELLEDEQMAQNEPLERFIDCPQCHKESGCYVRKDGFAECKHCGYYLNKDGKYVGTESCDICGKSGNVIEKKDSNSGNYYNICDSTECNTKEKNDGKVSCDKCGKFTDERQMNYYNAYAVCWRCDSDDDSCDECGGDGFIEYDNSSKKEGEVIESYDKEECNKCNGKGKIK